MVLEVLMDHLQECTYSLFHHLRKSVLFLESWILIEENLCIFAFASIPVLLLLLEHHQFPSSFYLVEILSTRKLTVKEKILFFKKNLIFFFLLETKMFCFG